MPNPLLDWREWILALVTGMVGAASFAWLQSRMRLGRWRRLRLARLNDLWREIFWISFNMHRNGWARGEVQGIRGLFPGYIDELKGIETKIATAATGVNLAALDATELAIVFKHLPGLRSMVPAMVALLDACVSDYKEAWSEHVLEHLIEARTALKRFAEWELPEAFDPDRNPFQISDAVEFCLKAMIALNWISIIVQDGSGGKPFAELLKKDPPL